MKKRVIAGWVLTILILPVLLFGCGSTSLDDFLVEITEEGSYEDWLTQEASAEEMSDSSTAEESASEKNDTEEVEEATGERQSLGTGDFIDIADISEGEMEARNRAGLTAENITKRKAEQEGRYAYDNLEDVYKTVYVELLLILENLEKDIVISDRNPDEIDVLFQCVMNDHPEIFYVRGYSYTKHTVGGEIQRISFSGTYTMDREQVEENSQRIASYAAACFADLPQDADEYEKVKHVYEYIINHTEYNLEARENQNICSVCIYKESVCQGYAKTMQYLLQELGVFATLVTGTVNTSGEGHAWNLVNINNTYYYVDATWGDASYVLNGEQGNGNNINLPSINYDYLCVTTEQLQETHVIKNVVPMPRCISQADNYYVREGLYLTSVDHWEIQDIFDRAYEEGKAYVTMKFIDAQVYERAVTYLLEEQGVFDYMRTHNGVISYTNNEKQNTLSFCIE